MATIQDLAPIQDMPVEILAEFFRWERREAAFINRPLQGENSARVWDVPRVCHRFSDVAYGSNLWQRVDLDLDRTLTPQDVRAVCRWFQYTEPRLLLSISCTCHAAVLSDSCKDILNCLVAQAGRWKTVEFNMGVAAWKYFSTAMSSSAHLIKLNSVELHTQHWGSEAVPARLTEMFADAPALHIVHLEGFQPRFKLPYEQLAVFSQHHLPTPMHCLHILQDVINKDRILECDLHTSEEPTFIVPTADSKIVLSELRSLTLSHNSILNSLETPQLQELHLPRGDDIHGLVVLESFQKRHFHLFESFRLKKLTITDADDALMSALRTLPDLTFLAVSMMKIVCVENLFRSLNNRDTDGKFELLPLLEELHVSCVSDALSSTKQLDRWVASLTGGHGGHGGGRRIAGRIGFELQDSHELMDWQKTELAKLKNAGIQVGLSLMS